MDQPEAFQEIADNLTFLDDWEERYRYIIELGQSLLPLAEAEKTNANKVHGCVSQVWLASDRGERAGEPVLNYRGESDAMIVQGLVAVLLALYSGRTAAEIAATDAIEIFDKLGLREHLTAQRANGLVAMVNRIRGEAKALS
ncbi:SufE family protein [Devosia rhodophyticola]|uniref:SufE family protein n=1 Tax=Devosia rhodophyticola TaxID=3026423 RepID=A0ABY7YYW4_9HYPH|nr:SufE family protein [Devosia rhodophyticola]WDR06422.1 SufE family protein [Devosia rhodophyticola]